MLAVLVAAEWQNLNMTGLYVVTPNTLPFVGNFYLKEATEYII